MRLSVALRPRSLRWCPPRRCLPPCPWLAGSRPRLSSPRCEATRCAPRSRSAARPVLCVPTLASSAPHTPARSAASRVEAHPPTLLRPCSRNCDPPPPLPPKPLSNGPTQQQVTHEAVEAMARDWQAKQAREAAAAAAAAADGSAGEGKDGAGGSDAARSEARSAAGRRVTEAEELRDMLKRIKSGEAVESSAIIKFSRLFKVTPSRASTRLQSAAMRCRCLRRMRRFPRLGRSLPPCSRPAPPPPHASARLAAPRRFAGRADPRQHGPPPARADVPLAWHQRVWLGTDAALSAAQPHPKAQERRPCAAAAPAPSPRCAGSAGVPCCCCALRALALSRLHSPPPPPTHRGGAQA